MCPKGTCSEGPTKTSPTPGVVGTAFESISLRVAELSTRVAASSTGAGAEDEAGSFGGCSFLNVAGLNFSDVAD